MSNLYSQARKLLSRLFRVGKGNLLQIEIMRLKRIRVLNLKPSVFRVKLGGPETTDQIVASLGFPADSHITQANFPIKPRAAIEEVEIVIVDPGRSFSVDECPAILAEAGLKPPTYEHAIRFVEQYGKRKRTTSKKKPFMVFPHEPWQNLCLLILNRYPWGRELYLRYPGDGFNDNGVVAGVQSCKQPSVG